MHDLRRSQTSSLDLLLCRIDQNILKEGVFSLSHILLIIRNARDHIT